jgi:predicted nuclease of restriction endonuclease-like (RecB) superfamily
MDNIEMQQPRIDFDSLVQQIEFTNRTLQNSARLVINRHVTAKAWLTGYYIVEYELHGSDRAKYGEKLLQNIAEKLHDNKAFSYRSLKLYKQFYLTYRPLASQISAFIQALPQIRQTVTAHFLPIDVEEITIRQTVSAQFPETSIVENSIHTKPELLFNRLSFSHLSLLLPIKDSLKRAFYESMAIRGTWSVRELQRQIDTNYFERSGWSQKPEHLEQLVDGKVEVATVNTDIKSPFVFEFLGLNAKDVVEESDLESALMDNLQNFILELGMGFCFEERQKKLLIDDRYYKADLVFYHRILKRHVVIELKAHRLDYTDVAQLNMYLAYYRKNIMLADDNEPIGILLCSEVGQEMAEYTMMGADVNLFVSNYKLELPSTERITEFLRKENEGLYKEENK